eukprot:3773894-Amphidinium_carterae.1
MLRRRNMQLDMNWCIFTGSVEAVCCVCCARLFAGGMCGDCLATSGWTCFEADADAYYPLRALDKTDIAGRVDVNPECEEGS